jgi:hypothetical protein
MTSEPERVGAEAPLWSFALYGEPFPTATRDRCGVRLAPCTPDGAKPMARFSSPRNGPFMNAADADLRRLVSEICDGTHR